MVEEEVERTYEDFWKEIIEPDGIWDFDQIKRELHDYYVVMTEARKVYCEITRGRISKVNTAADVVLSFHEKLCHKDCGFDETD